MLARTENPNPLAWVFTLPGKGNCHRAQFGRRLPNWLTITGGRLIQLFTRKRGHKIDRLRMTGMAFRIAEKAGRDKDHLVLGFEQSADQIDQSLRVKRLG